VAATATTLVALVAMSTAVSGACPVRGIDVATRGETPVARAVAAVVAAVARDLAGSERSAAAAARLEPADLPAPEPVSSDWTPTTTPLALSRLDERLLDLPPPLA
jgi:hypothetical protein